MIEMKPLYFNAGVAQAITVHLPKTTLLVVATEIGYIMCGALDVGLLNEKLAHREIIAGRATGVKTIQELLDAPLESVTYGSVALGIEIGTKGSDAIEFMLSHEKRT